MGGSSRSSSSSRNTTSTSTHNESLNGAISGDLEAGATALNGKEITINQNDPGAFNFASKTLEGVGGIITQLLENQSETYGAANDLAGTAIANLAAASGADPVEIGKKPFTQNQKMLLAGGGFITVSALVYFLRRGKK